MPPQIRQFFERQTASPFETMLAIYFAYAAVATMLNFGIVASPLTNLLGAKIAVLTNVAYLLAGLAMYFGIGLRKGNVEAFGLILVMTSLSVRAVATAWLLGTNPMIINSYVSTAVFLLACMVRLRMIFKSQQVLEGVSDSNL